MTSIRALRALAPAAVGRAHIVTLAALAFQGFILAVNGVAAPWIMRSFALDQAAMARAFAWISVSALGAFALARAADRVGRGRVLWWSIAIESVSAIGVALAPSIVIFAVCEIGLLSCAGAAMMCGIVWMAEATADADRARGQSLAGLAVVIGSGPAVVLMPWLASTALSWRAQFVFAAAACALLPFVRRDLRGRGAGGATDANRLAAARGLFDGRYRPLTLLFIVTTFLSTIATASVGSWRYVHMVDDVGLAPALASAIVLGAGIVALAGFPLGAMATDRLGRVPAVAGCLLVNGIALTWAFWGPPAGAGRPWLWLAAGFA